jgi:hypothetical protein
LKNRSSSLPENENQRTETGKRGKKMKLMNNQAETATSDDLFWSV